MKNALYLILLLLAGCSANSSSTSEAPAPLDKSTDVAANPTSTETMADSALLVGVWKLSNRAREETYTFKEDGTYQIVLKARPDPQVRGMIVEGTYEMTSPSTIQFYVQGKPTQLQTIRLNGDVLEREVAGNWLEWRRSS